MVVAQMYSDHYAWIALGETEAEAVNAIVNKWNDRRNKLKELEGFEMPYATDQLLREMYGIGIFKLKVGECYYE